MALFDLTTLDFDEDEEYEEMFDDENNTENTSIGSSGEDVLDMDAEKDKYINRLNKTINELTNDKRIINRRLEKIKNLLHLSILKDKNTKEYLKEVVSDSHKLLECFLSQHQQIFEIDYFHYPVFFIENFFIPVMGDDFLSYMDRLAPYLCEALNSNPGDDKDIHEMAMDTIDIIFLRFKTKLLPYCDCILKILIKTFAKMNPTDPNIFYLCHSIYKIYKIIGKNFVAWIEPILEIIDKIACYIFFKMNNDNMEVDSDEDDSGDDELKAICLCFYSRTCETDLLLIHARKFQIIDYLNADTSVNLDPEDNTLIIAKLRLIKNLLIYFNFEIYILLDTKHIAELFKIGNQSDNHKIKSLTESITFKIDNYKAELRKFYIKYGYAKILN